MSEKKYIEIEGRFNAVSGKPIAIVAARFNEVIVDKLVDGAVDALTRHGVNTDNIHVIRVPGAFEIGVVMKRALESGRYCGGIALGTVIRGETTHYDYVCGGVTNAINTVMQSTGLPVAFGVLTTETVEQAQNRAGLKAGNKGFEAAMSFLETMNVLNELPHSELL